MKSNPTKKAGGRRPGAPQANTEVNTKRRVQGDQSTVDSEAEGAAVETAGEAQPDPHKMSAAPLRGETGGSGPQQSEQRGSPNVHMEEDASGDESPRFDR